MAKERFLIVATRMYDDCFSRFSESANREAINAGVADPHDAYSWVEASFEIQLRRWREATYICSFTPCARFEWLQDYFVGVPNAAWADNPDPENLEAECGGNLTDYGTYYDKYDPRFICADFTIYPASELGLRKPRGNNSDAGMRYHNAIWERALETAQEMIANGAAGAAPILDVLSFRRWERDERDRVRATACARSRALRPGEI